MEGNNIEILNINDNYYEKTLEFLGEVKALKSIEEEIVRNASIIVDQDLVVGAISYEKFGLYGLIRYFIFKKTVSDYYVTLLMQNLEKKAYSDGITCLFSIILDKEVEDLFFELEFEVMDKNKIFIEEERFSDSKYKNTTVMSKKLDSHI